MSIVKGDMSQEYLQNLNAELAGHVQTLQGRNVLSAVEGARLITVAQGRSMRVRQRYNANLRRAVNDNLVIQNVPSGVFQTSDRRPRGGGAVIMSNFSLLMQRNARMEAVANRIGNAGFVLSTDLARRFERMMQYYNRVRGTLLEDLERVDLDVLRTLCPLITHNGRRVRVITAQRLRDALRTTLWRQLDYFVVFGWAFRPTSQNDERTNFERITGHPLPEFVIPDDDDPNPNAFEDAENAYYQEWLDLHNQGVLRANYNLRGDNQLVEYDERHAPVRGRFVEGDNSVPFLRAIRDDLYERNEEFYQYHYDFFIVYDTERYAQQQARGQETVDGYVLRKSDKDLRVYVTLFGATYQQALIDNGCVPTAMAKCFCPTKSDKVSVQINKQRRDVKTVVAEYEAFFKKTFKGGVTIGELKVWLGTGINQQDLSTYLFDQHGNLVVSYTSPNAKGNTGRYRKALVGWVHNNHLYVVQDKKLRDIMCKSAEAHSNPKFSLGQEVKQELPVRVVPNVDELRKIVRERTENGVVPRIFGKGLRNWRVAMFDDEVVKVLTPKEEELSREMAQVLEVPFEGQKFVSLIGDLMQKHGIDLKHFESAFNAETMQIYNNDNKALASSYGLCKFWYPTGRDYSAPFNAVDQIKAYTNTVLKHITELPIFDMTERIVEHDEGHVFDPKSLYYIETEGTEFNPDLWGIRGNGWYYGALLKSISHHSLNYYSSFGDIIDDFDVVYRVTPARWVSAEPFKKLFQWCIDNLSEKCAKNVCNSIVGLFGQMTKFKSIEVHMSESRDDVMFGNVFDKFQVGEAELVLYGTKPEIKTSETHCVPINHYIVQMAQLRLWEAGLKLQDEGYTILGVKTDCIVYEGCYPTEDTDDYKACDVPIFHCENKTPWRTQRFKFTPIKPQIYFRDDAERFNALIKEGIGCMVTGGAGNGKSYTMTKSRLFRFHSQETLVMAPSWVATLNVVNNVRGETNHMTAQMALLYRNLDYIGQRYRYIVVDEVSMVSPKMLQSLLYLKRKHGSIVYLFGDLSQLLAIGCGSWRWDLALAELCPYHMELTVFRRGDPMVKMVADQLRVDAEATFDKIKVIMSTQSEKFGFESTRSAISVRHKDKNLWNTECAEHYAQEHPDGVWLESAKVTVGIKETKIDDAYSITGLKALPQEEILTNVDNIEPAGVVEKDDFWSVPFYIFKDVQLIAYNTVSTKNCKFYNSQILTVKSIDKEAKTFLATIDGKSDEITVPFKVASSSLQYAPKFGCVTIYKSQGLTFDYKYCVIGTEFMCDWLAKKCFDTFRRYVYVAFTRATSLEYISLW